MLIGSIALLPLYTDMSILTLLLAESIAEPIAELREASRRVGAGDFAARPAYRTSKASDPPYSGSTRESVPIKHGYYSV
jgi:hypothetical protein